MDILDSMAFEWSPLADELTGDDLWQKRYDELIAFKEAKGTSVVPRKYPRNQALANWVTTQRYQRKRMDLGKKPVEITAERIEKLDELNFVWKIRERSPRSWEERISELKEFKAESGHCGVPQKYPSNPRLGKWVSKQRFEYKQHERGLPNGLSEEKIKELQALGFLFETDLSRKRKANKEKARQENDESSKQSGEQETQPARVEKGPVVSDVAASGKVTGSRKSCRGQGKKRQEGQSSEQNPSRKGGGLAEHATHQEESSDSNRHSERPSQTALV